MNFEQAREAARLTRSYEQVCADVDILDRADTIECRVNRGEMMFFQKGDAAFDQTLAVMRAVLFADKLTIEAHLRRLGVDLPPLRPTSANAA